MKLLPAVEFLTPFNSIPNTRLAFLWLVMYGGMLNPYGAEGLILGLVSLIPLL